jgi:hypothetical protein
MNEQTTHPEHKDRTLVLAIIGILLLSIGAVAAFLGPTEMYCFYLFSEGGRFHYEGFGFGSFMFGNIAAQIVGYYLIAILAIPLGYGHLKLRRWARILSVTLLWFWLIVGVPLIVVAFFMLVTAKDLSLAAGVAAIILLGLSYFAVPGLLIRFYQSRNVRATFETKDPNSYWLEKLPLPVLVLGALYVFYIMVLHVPIFFNGIFPFFGVFFFGLEGIFLLDISILGLVGLIWGTLRLRPWAWWGALLYFGLLTFSTIFTFARASYLDILSRMKFPPTEMEPLQRPPFQGFHFAILMGIPLLITLGVIIFSKRHFTSEGE